MRKHCCLCDTTIDSRQQQFGEHVSETTNIQAALEETEAEVTLQLTVSQLVRLCVEPTVGLSTRY
jgi:hypothetical protein